MTDQSTTQNADSEDAVKDFVRTVFNHPWRHIPVIGRKTKQRRQRRINRHKSGESKTYYTTADHLPNDEFRGGCKPSPPTPCSAGGDHATR